MDNRTLDWVPRFDDRSRNFRVAAVKGETRNCDWKHGPILDQGSEGACVGFAATANLASTKRALKIPDGAAVGRALYRYAQTVDEWEGEGYEGTSVLAGMKALKQHGFVSRYEWSFGIQDVLWAVSWRGPVQIGVWWFSNMWDTDADGFVHASGYHVGGHSVLISGVDPEGEFVTITNSWGPGWGVRGQAKLSYADLDKLLRDDGEAVSIVKVRPTL